MPRRAQVDVRTHAYIHTSSAQSPRLSGLFSRPPAGSSCAAAAFGAPSLSTWLTPVVGGEHVAGVATAHDTSEPGSTQLIDARAGGRVLLPRASIKNAFTPLFHRFITYNCFAILVTLVGSLEPLVTECEEHILHTRKSDSPQRKARNETSARIKKNEYLCSSSKHHRKGVSGLHTWGYQQRRLSAQSILYSTMNPWDTICM